MKKQVPHHRPRRNRVIRSLRAADWTLERIGGRVGISRERVRQILETRARRKGNMSEGCNFGKKFALLAVLFTGLVQAEKPCDADPRYLLVTAVAERSWYRNKESGEMEERTGASWSKPRPILLDRCENIKFSNAYHPSPYFPDEKIAQSGADVFGYEGSQLKSMRKIRIKESMSDICWVMKDCGDATK